MTIYEGAAIAIVIYLAVAVVHAWMISRHPLHRQCGPLYLDYVLFGLSWPYWWALYIYGFFRSGGING